MSSQGRAALPASPAEEQTDVTFNLRDFRAMLSLCEGLGGDVIIRLEGPGQPVVLEPHLSGAHGQVRVGHECTHAPGECPLPMPSLRLASPTFLAAPPRRPAQEDCRAELVLATLMESHSAGYTNLQEPPARQPAGGPPATAAPGARTPGDALLNSPNVPGDTPYLETAPTHGAGGRQAGKNRSAQGGQGVVGGL